MRFFTPYTNNITMPGRNTAKLVTCGGCLDNMVYNALNKGSFIPLMYCRSSIAIDFIPWPHSILALGVTIPFQNFNLFPHQLKQRSQSARADKVGAVFARRTEEVRSFPQETSSEGRLASSCPKVLQNKRCLFLGGAEGRLCQIQKLGHEHGGLGESWNFILYTSDIWVWCCLLFFELFLLLGFCCQERPLQL